MFYLAFVSWSGDSSPYMTLLGRNGVGKLGFKTLLTRVPKNTYNSKSILSDSEYAPRLHRRIFKFRFMIAFAWVA